MDFLGEVLGEIIWGAIQAMLNAIFSVPVASPSDKRPVFVADAARGFGPHIPPDPARGRTATIFFASGSAELDEDARALIAYAGEVYAAQPIDWLTLDASYERREVADAKGGRVLARARIKAVQDALENGGLSLSYLARLREPGLSGRDSSRRVRIELPLRVARWAPKLAA